MNDIIIITKPDPLQKNLVARALDRKNQLVYDLYLQPDLINGTMGDREILIKQGHFNDAIHVRSISAGMEAEGVGYAGKAATVLWGVLQAGALTIDVAASDVDDDRPWTKRILDPSQEIWK